MVEPLEVSSWNEVLDNFNNYDITRKDTFAYRQVARASHWYYNPGSDSFAPSKFLGYKNMTMEAYDGSGAGTVTVQVLNEYFDKLHKYSEDFHLLLFKLEKITQMVGKKVSKRTTEKSGGIYIPKDNYVPRDSWKIPITVMSTDMQSEFENLFMEFLKGYFKNKGQWHLNFYRELREQSRSNYQGIIDAKQKDQDASDLILLGLLPYNDFDSNRKKGAWIHVAPAITGDLKGWFENAGWTNGKNWPGIADLIFKFIAESLSGQQEMWKSCQLMSSSPLAKGFQMGMLTPILNALDPNTFMLINNKSRAVINHFTNSKFSSDIADYPQINSIGKVLVKEVEPTLSLANVPEAISIDIFDTFCHWIVAEKQYFKSKQACFKIAPGDQASNWDNCLKGKYISIGWDDFGDLSDITSGDFENRLEEVFKKHPKWKKHALNQVKLFKTIPEGALIIANKGTTEIVGAGMVKGNYYFVEGERFGHRIPVDWYDTAVRSVDEPGWTKTIIKLSKQKVNRLLKSNNSGPHKTWIFQGNPKYYDIQGAIEELDEIRWSVNQHVNEIKSGDKVYIWMSGKNSGILAKAQVVGNPVEMESDEDDEFVIDPSKIDGKKRRVLVHITKRFETPIYRKDLKGHPGMENLQIIRQAYGTNFPVKPEEEELIEKFIELGHVPLPEEQLCRYSVLQFMEETGIQKEIVDAWLARLKRKKQIIFQGPPGTGKTFIAERIAKLLISGSNGFCDIVQFHPSYSYEDFMQGFRPRAAPQGGLDFELEPGRFLEFCRQARRTDAPCVLIVDEINRAHLSRVFGELMYLLEYRHKEMALSSGGEVFKIPENVYIIGTMNTADRSIALVDHALRRRFSFIRLEPDFDILDKYLSKYKLPAKSLIAVLKEVNRMIGDPNYFVGVSFFMSDGEKLKDYMPEIWSGEIEPYLEEYFYDQPDKIKSFRWRILLQDKLKDWAT